MEAPAQTEGSVQNYLLLNLKYEVLYFYFHFWNA